MASKVPPATCRMLHATAWLQHQLSHRQLNLHAAHTTTTPAATCNALWQLLLMPPRRWSSCYAVRCCCPMHVACTPRSINNDKIAFPHMAGTGNGIGIGIEPGSGSGSGRLMTFGMQRLTNAAAAAKLATH